MPPLTIASHMSILQTIKIKQTAKIAIGFALAAGFLLVVGILSTYGTFTHFDLAIRKWVVSVQSPLLTSIFLSATWLGSTVQLFVLGSMVVLTFIWLRQWRLLGLFLLAMIGQITLHLGFKALFAIQRPEPLINNYVIDDSYSFPSGHAIAATSFFGFLALFLLQRFKSTGLRVSISFLATAVIFLICFSRIYIGVHRPSDVLAGFIAGAIWIAALPLGQNNSVTASD